MSCWYIIITKLLSSADVYLAGWLASSVVSHFDIRDEKVGNATVLCGNYVLVFMSQASVLYRSVYTVNLHFESFTHTKFCSAVYEKMNAFFI